MGDEIDSLEKLVSKADDNESDTEESATTSYIAMSVLLGRSGPLLYVMSYNGDVPEVESGVNFIHEVQWCRLEDMQRKYQRKGRECLFATRKIGDVFP